MYWPSLGVDVGNPYILRCAQDDILDRLSRSSCRSWLLKIINAEHIRFAQCKLREASHCPKFDISPQALT